MASDEIPARQAWSTAAAADPGEIASIPTPMLRRADAVAFVGGKLAAALIAPLTAADFTIVAVEQRHSMLAELPPEAPEYEAFGNGHGEIHNARAFRQLVERATRSFTPSEDRWHEDGRVIDPFRPELRYAAASDREFDVLQERYLNTVRTAFRRAKTLVVALSASEVWESQADGTVFPGVAGAANPRFDAERHAARTLTVEETVADLGAAVAALRGVNPGLEIMLMVSPEPPAATALPVHVLAAATVGKAVLRIAIETAAQAEGVQYFPALELASRHIGLGGFPTDGTIPDRVVAAVAGAMVAISEGGGVAFDGSAPPIVTTQAPSVALAPAAAAGPQPAAKTNRAAGKPKPGAKPKTVSAEPVDAYTELRAAQQKQKKERQRKKAPPPPADEGETQSGESKREAKQAERAAKQHDKVAARNEKRAADHDAKRAAVAEAKQARGRNRAAKAAAGDARTDKSEASAAAEPTEAAPRPNRGGRRSVTPAAAPATAATSGPATEASSTEATPPRAARRQAKIAARSAARAKPDRAAAVPDPALAPEAAQAAVEASSPTRGKGRRAMAAAAVSVPPVETATPKRTGQRRARAAAQSAPTTEPETAGADPERTPVARSGRARKAKTADKASAPTVTGGDTAAPRAGRRRSKAKTA